MPDGRDCCRRPPGWQQKKSHWSSTALFSRGERALLPFSGGPAVPPGSVVPWFFNKINFQNTLERCVHCFVRHNTVVSMERHDRRRPTACAAEWRHQQKIRNIQKSLLRR